MRDDEAIQLDRHDALRAPRDDRIDWSHFVSSMNTHLNKQQIEHYRRDGFAVHENLLTKSELAELRYRGHAVATVFRLRGP